MNDQKVKFYQVFGGRKAFISLLLFATSLLLFILQHWLDFEVITNELFNFWKWLAGIFAVSNVAQKGFFAKFSNNKTNE